MTRREQLQYERRGALQAVAAIKALRHPPRTVAVDLAIGMAEHAARKVVETYTRQINAPEPRELPLDVEPSGPEGSATDVHL